MALIPGAALAPAAAGAERGSATTETAVHGATQRAESREADAERIRRPKFQMPFRCGAKRQGATYRGHGGAGNHYPLDFNRGGGDTDLGDPVVASARGKVRRWVRSDGAKIITIRHNRVWKTDYRHLSKFAVRNGATVRKGQRIGRVGKTGSGVSSAHLHYEQQRRGKAVHIKFNGKWLKPKYSFTYNGPTYTSRNC